MSKAKKIVVGTIAGILGLIILVLLVFVCIYATRISTMSSIKQITQYDDSFDIYTMDVKYKYDIQDFIDKDLKENQEIFDAILDEALPLLPISVNTPKFGCTAFQVTTTEGTQLMGRNYDFKKNTSAMLVKCNPKDGYKSIAFAALDNASANQPLSSISKKMASLTSPFICLDGMNEKGVSIAVLVVDSDPVHYDTEKGNIFTTLAIRLVLDKAASTQEAVDLLSNYDMFASSGKDYHFYINDASGDGRVVEWDCESETRELVATKVDVVTNFYTIYADKVEPNQYNGIYGHGKERYNAVKDVLTAQEGNHSLTTAWDALKASSQVPSETDITSNTQWSIVFDNSNLTIQIVMRRHWDDIYTFDIDGNLM